MHRKRRTAGRADDCETMPDEPDTEILNPFPDRDGSRKDREDRIRKRAHEIWEAAGRPEGRETEHWSAAEIQISEKVAEPFAKLVVPGVPIPDIRSADPPGLSGQQADSVETVRSSAPTAPKTAGAAKPAADTSRSPVANRDTAGPRKAGTTPRPTDKPVG